MWALVVFLYVQTNLDVDIVNVRIDARSDLVECERRAIIETKPLPLEVGNAARWQYATCVRVQG